MHEQLLIFEPGNLLYLDIIANIIVIIPSNIIIIQSRIFEKHHC